MYCLHQEYPIANLNYQNRNLEEHRFGDYLALQKKYSFPLKISSVNVIKSAENCRFGHIY